VFCTGTSLGVGGGDHFAVLFDGTLQEGSSGPCETFNSPALVPSTDGLEIEGSSRSFEVRHFEVWAVGGESDADLPSPPSQEATDESPTNSQIERVTTVLPNVRLSQARQDSPERSAAPVRPLSFVLCVDASDHATLAARWLALHVRCNDTVHVYTAGAHTTAIQRAQMLFTNMDEYRVSCNAEETHKGSASSAITRFAEKVAPDVVVMGSCGETRSLLRMLMGSVSRHVLHHCVKASMAVWVVSTPALSWPPSFLLCVDESPSAQQAIDLLINLLTPEARVVILCPHSPGTTTSPTVREPDPAAAARTALRWCADAARRILDAGVLCSVTPVALPVPSPEKAAQQAIRLAEAEDIRTIVTGAQPRGVGPAFSLGPFVSHLLDHSVFGSVLIVG